MKDGTNMRECAEAIKWTALDEYGCPGEYRLIVSREGKICRLTVERQGEDGMGESKWNRLNNEMQPHGAVLQLLLTLFVHKLNSPGQAEDLPSATQGAGHTAEIDSGAACGRLSIIADDD